MKKICVITAARSEYGVLKWLMYDIKNSNSFELQIIVTGGHLSYEQGHTVDNIIEDGFKINYCVDAKLNTSSTANIAKSMGFIAEGMAEALDKLKPDLVVVLGDRYELLPICNTAYVMRIPIAHISGGDVTEGAIDDGIRNAVTMLADYHFPGTKESAENIVRMRGKDENIWTVGEPGLDSFNREKLLARKELAEILNLDESKKWLLMTYHSETKETFEYNIGAVSACVEELLKLEGYQTIITYANADYMGKQINEYIENQAKLYPEKIKVIPSLGHYKYLSYMKQVRAVIGNSSSGILEAPFANVPVINVGNRQKGRYLCKNIYTCEATKEAIRNAFQKLLNCKNVLLADDRNYWGDGHASERILKVLNNILNKK